MVCNDLPFIAQKGSTLEKWLIDMVKKTAYVLELGAFMDSGNILILLYGQWLFWAANELTRCTVFWY
jgi:hypothetical protein